MSRRPLVSYIIVTHNRRELLEKLLSSIIAQKFYNECEIIIIDDASTDNTYELLQEFTKKTNNSDIYCNINIVRNEKPKFVATSRNQGAKIASGRYLFFIDDDVELDRNCTKKLIDFLENNKEFVAATPLILDIKGNVLTCGIRRSYLGLNYPYIPHRIYRGYAVVDEAITLYAIRKEDFEKIYGYNPKFLFYYEESEMFYRLKYITGGKIACVYGAKAYHYVEKHKLWKINLLKAYLLGRNRIWFYKEWCNSKFHYLLCLLTWITLASTYYLINFVSFKNFYAFVMMLRGIKDGLYRSS